MSSQTRNDFTKGSMASNMLKLAVPMTFAQLINVLYNVVDRMYIGHIPETGMLSLTGLGVTFPIIMFVTAFTRLFGDGGAPLTSIARGEGKLEYAEKIMNNSFQLLVLSGLILTVLGLLFKKPLLYAFGASDATWPYADQYITIYLLGSVFVMVGLGMNSFINAQGFARVGMFSVLIGALINIVLDPVFIFLLGMGVRGAALATIISQGVVAVWVLRFLTSDKAILRLSLKPGGLEKDIIKRIFGLGLSGFTMACTNSAVQIACNASLQTFGGDLYVGVMTVLNSVREIIFMPVHGLTSGAQPVLGYNYGAKEYQRIKEGIRFITITGILFCTFVWVLLMLFPAFWIRIFNQDPELIRIGTHALRLYYMGYFLMSLQSSGQSVFVGLGKSKQAIFFSLFRKVILVVPLVLILPHLFGLGVDGVFLSEPISDLVGGGACYLAMYFTLYRKLGKS
ncbi:MAG: MATE family efflux transporter [Firmicutes bacterium]|nr:MATE family efflux transporter [Bacillota bacterium]